MAEDFSAGEPTPQGERGPSCPNGRLSYYLAFCNYTEARAGGSQGAEPFHSQRPSVLRSHSKPPAASLPGGFLESSQHPGLPTCGSLSSWEAGPLLDHPLKDPKPPDSVLFPPSVGLTAGGRCLMEASLGCTPGTFLLKPSSFPLLIAQVRSRKPKGRTLVSPCWYSEVTAPVTSLSNITHLVPSRF